MFLKVFFIMCTYIMHMCMFAICKSSEPTFYCLFVVLYKINYYQHKNCSCDSIMIRTEMKNNSDALSVYAKQSKLYLGYGSLQCQSSSSSLLLSPQIQFLQINTVPMFECKCNQFSTLFRKSAILFEVMKYNEHRSEPPSPCTLAATCTPLSNNYLKEACLLKAYSPTNRIGSPQGIYLKEAVIWQSQQNCV